MSQRKAKAFRKLQNEIEGAQIGFIELSIKTKIISGEIEKLKLAQKRIEYTLKVPLPSKYKWWEFWR